ncbi:hypothetical protein GCM10010954_29960 [Halobacillus andaensis]|uniref:Lipoprotein n=1 Tax=Halobacillus andaensis TaxID=1176239 RepID=A0A917B940_HALAA|nr:hypothetical protein [Halobacillus andaensis]MBP2005098.1 hypothetical protein [Halobacillus andaensis]GGF28873.1 hypothetical protein GCM10010954_29960 [Halobacillus andaensis]
MNNKLIIIITLLYITSLLAACNQNEEQGAAADSDSKEEVENSEEQDKTEESNEEESTSNDLSEAFIPPDFVVQKFKTTFNDEENKMNMALDYKVSPELYEKLKDHEYYFYLNYPEEIQSIIDSEHTDLVKGSKMMDANRLDYSVSFEQSISQDVDQGEIEALTDNRNYDLYITNGEKEIVHVFKDVAIGAEFDSEESSSVEVDEED